MTFRGLGTVLVALFACGRGERLKEKQGASGPALTSTERVISTLPLELGEGDSREARATFWPADSSPALKLPAGTRIEKLEEPAGFERPRGLPDGGSPAHAFWRVRVTEGDRLGLVGYVRSYQVQAAR